MLILLSIDMPKSRPKLGHDYWIMNYDIIFRYICFHKFADARDMMEGKS